MEWVEKTGKTVAEATERALEQLGVAETDAELVVLDEPKTGLFGRVRGEARVRARVRPAEPRPKRTRRSQDRTRRAERTGGGSRNRSRERAGARPASAESDERPPAPGGSTSESSSPGSGGTSGASRRRRRRRSGGSRETNGHGEPESKGRAPGNESTNGQRDGDGQRAQRPQGQTKEEDTVADGITLAEQAEVAKEFIEGLLERYGLTATVEVRELDDQTVELAADGEGLGLLVGPKGATLAALQDVTRTVVQKRFPHRTDRILVDVAKYRERRAAALQRFTQQVAQEVLASGDERALEPMSAADRKVVHDTAVSIEGVQSSSRGDEPNRFVVVSPAS